jgi:hypothetical protein
MPRRQRFKPSRKPKPAIEPSENEFVPQSSEGTPPVGQKLEEMHPDDANSVTR